MSRWILGICAAVLGGVLIANDVEAKRLGGARSSGWLLAGIQQMH